MTGRKVPLLAVPHLDPGHRRIEIEVPEGLTLAEMLRVALPGATPDELKACRIALVSAHGSEVILPAFWHQVRPRPGVRVVIRVIAEGDGLRSVLTVVVAIAAVAAAAWVAGTYLGLTAGTFAYSAAYAGTALAVTALGNLLINALIPPVTADSRDAENRYSISGFKNTLDPNGAVPVVLGTIRFAPPYALRGHSEIVGDFQYIRAAFLPGEGQLSLSDIQIGETSISEFDYVDIETRDGLDTDLPLSIFTSQVAEESVSVELVRPLPRDELGEVIDDDPSEASPVVRATGADASGASIIFAFPSGLIRYDDSGKSHTESVSVLIEHRLVEAEEWQEVETLEIRAKKLESFYRQYTWTFPSRGRWQVRVTMLTDETTDTQIQRRCSWAALQTLRPEYPLNYSLPLALIATRIKATYQLSGALDNVSVLASRICPDYDADTGTWIERATSNPASLYRYVLQSPANPKAVVDSGIDLDQIEDWHDFCRENGLKYDRVLQETTTSLRDVLTEITAAGRATPRHDGVKWGVAIDRAQELVVDHISPRNSWGFKSKRTYFEPPHAFRVKFKDATNDYKDAERVVRWPGYDGEITLTEGLELPGKTDPDEIWIEARRRMYETLYRPDTYQVTQKGPIRVATRGDKVMASHDVLDSVQRGAKVKSVMGKLIELDDLVTMEAGQSYAVRFRVFEDAEDTIGSSVVRTVSTVSGNTRVLTATGTGDMPEAGDQVLFGNAGTESLALIVRGVEATQDGHSILHMVDEAAIIDELLAQDEVPAWSGRVGAEIDENLSQPSAPRFTSVRTTSGPLIDVLIEPGSGVIATARYTVYHRLLGETAWSSLTIQAASGGGTISGYALADTVELQAEAVSPTDVVGPLTTTIEFVVGSDQAAIPAALDSASIDITTLLGGALIQVATGADEATEQLQVYRSLSSTLDRETDAVGSPVATSPLQSYSITLGDTTRQELITDGAMGNAASWTADTGWEVVGGLAQHTAGTADSLSQALTMTSGKFYRVYFTVSGRTAGSVTPRLTGGSDRPGVTVSANGDQSDRIQAVTGNDTVEFLASTDFDGAIDDVSVYLETDACLVQGTHYLWIEPQNADGVPGPVSGPFTISI
ncbi:phage tail protein [Pseudooceanicola sp. CBS1P-1]|uniref:Phage tail protein n=1 Tax=Pseudooceanicola albus TaxID=2692189 RepID=A0A6L7FZY2_9RHOB|nr:MULTISPECIES: phage tail protein [Pseudooceanicola]MBT9382233.1 phage tail protein [Pseudooceanicola endophyticus]MXN16776.1 phage tail protein [Pseudooceanicola albus]